MPTRPRPRRPCGRLYLLPAARATIRAGRFALPATTWAALLAAADANGGRLTRDAATKVLAARTLSGLGDDGGGAGPAGYHRRRGHGNGRRPGHHRRQSPPPHWRLCPRGRV
jgi:hypothetical protein